MFGMRSSAMSEIFWEVVEEFIETKGQLENFRTDLMQERAQLYAEAIQDKGKPLGTCVGFIDCTKLQMSRLGGENALQRACYSGQKRFHCLIFQTVTTPDGLVFHIFGPEAGQCHDMTLFRQSGLNEELQSHFMVGGMQYPSGRLNSTHISQIKKSSYLPIRVRFPCPHDARKALKIQEGVNYKKGTEHNQCSCAKRIKPETAVSVLPRT